jgi:hypothetical protein
MYDTESPIEIYYKWVPYKLPPLSLWATRPISSQLIYQLIERNIRKENSSEYPSIEILLFI